MTDDDSKSIIFPPGEKEEEEENRTWLGLKLNTPQKPGSVETASSKLTSASVNRLEASPAHLSPFPHCFLSSNHLPVKLCLASGAFHMLFPLPKKSFEPGSLRPYTTVLEALHNFLRRNFARPHPRLK